MQHSSVRSVTTTTTEPAADELSERRIRRLRLTLHAGDTTSQKSDTRKPPKQTEEKGVNGPWKGRNGLMQRERPAGRESPELEDKHPDSTANGLAGSPAQGGPKVYGVVQRTGSDRQQQVMAYEWSVGHLRDEMKYIREVRDSLEKVRERMYGQFGGMQQSMQKLSQEIRVANSQRRTLENEVRVRTAALDSFDQMNSSLISANIGLQKSLLESCQDRMGFQDDLKTLRTSCQKAEERLRERERELEAAQAEKQALKLQVESAQEANSQALKELSTTLRRQYEEQLQEQQRKHREEIEALQAQLDEYARRLEEAERSARAAQAQIAERDQRISDLERLLDCMDQEKRLLTQKLQDCEQRLRGLDETDHVDKANTKKSEQLHEEASELRERIKHLNDMVFCQQRKVKGMIEEVETLRAKVVQKDLFISELLDRIAIVECENTTENKVQTRDMGVGCDLPRRFEMPPPMELAPHPPATPTFRAPSRLDYSLLKYTPVQYSSMLQTHSTGTVTSPTQTTCPPTASVQSGDEQSTSDPSSPTSPLPERSSPTSPRSKSSPSKVYTPFMKLMEMTAKINIE